MAMNKKPTTGMKDVLPAEMEIRDYVMNIIKETYREYGYNTIETPCVEHIENLTSKQGGDNEKLIFKILKRGEKLGAAFESGNIDELVDSGLRYDLTVPLCRYYSNNQANLLTPFRRRDVSDSSYSAISMCSAIPPTRRRSRPSSPSARPSAGLCRTIT